MDHTVRCTVCAWRGTTSEAASVRVQRAALPPALEEIQRAYEEKAAENEALGVHRTPNCPVCGNHTLPVHLHRHTAAM